MGENKNEERSIAHLPSTERRRRLSGLPHETQRSLEVLVPEFHLSPLTPDCRQVLHVLQLHLCCLVKDDTCVGHIAVSLIELGKSNPKRVRFAHSLQTESCISLILRYSMLCCTCVLYYAFVRKKVCHDKNVIALLIDLQVARLCLFWPFFCRRLSSYKLIACTSSISLSCSCSWQQHSACFSMSHLLAHKSKKLHFLHQQP
jgi:hypothetical protein